WCFRWTPHHRPGCKSERGVDRCARERPDRLLLPPDDSEQFRVAPWTYRQPGWQADDTVIPEGGTSHVQHGTAGVRDAARRRGGGVADGGAGATRRPATAHWLSR